MNASMIARRRHRPRRASPSRRRRRRALWPGRPNHYAGANEESEYVKPKIGVGAALAAILAVVLISNR